MCRVLAYLGQPMLADDLLYKPGSSLVHQAINPRMLHMLNLGGFGMMAWDPRSPDPETPFTYRSLSVPVFDSNLKLLAEKIRATALLAHVRGVKYDSRSEIGEQNLHPFRFEGFPLALAHNGDLHRFPEMKYALLEFVKPAIAQKIRGSTDSEWVYAVLMSQLADPTAYQRTADVIRALENTLKILRRVRERFDVSSSSPLNLLISDGRSLVGLRFTFDFGCYETDDLRAVHEATFRYLSLWYTSGREYGFHDGEWKMIGGKGADSVLVASEPLTVDVSTWLEVPEYNAVAIETTGGRPKLEITEIDV